MKANYRHGSVWGDNNLFLERKLLPVFWIENGLLNLITARV
jgi:hypothetical protein